MASNSESSPTQDGGYKKRKLEEMEPDSSKIQAAARLLSEANIIVLACGAGMGVDSGLGTFRGLNARAVHPALQAMGLRYEDMCSKCLLESNLPLYWAAW